WSPSTSAARSPRARRPRCRRTRRSSAPTSERRPEMAALLEVEGLKAYYGQTQALHDVSFALEQGGITTLLGANGAGKTTGGLATEEVVRLGVAHVPEGRGTFTNLSVDENLRVAAYTRSDRAAVERDREMVFEYFPILKQRLSQQAG